jgi:sulfate transport system substrate-binding protein
MNIQRIIRTGFAIAGLSILAAALPASAQDAPAPVTLTLAGYAVPREAYGDIIPAFQSFWQEQAGQQVIVLESYQASGAQSRAIAGGFEADIAALSLEPDITRLVDAGVITRDWRDTASGGIATDSVVVLVVRPGNPRGIQDWDDLAQEGLEIITPDPATSGGAQWNILAAYGAALRGFVEGYEASPEGAAQLLADIVPNIAVLDRDGRESFLTFERAIGDVAITYENEFYAGLIAGGEYEVIYPTSSILIQNPVAVVDVYADAHGVLEVADAFVSFLQSEDAQRTFAEHGFRPVNEDVFEAVVAEPIVVNDVTITFPELTDLFRIDDLGGWSEARPLLFGDEGLFTQLLLSVQS